MNGWIRSLSLAGLLAFCGAALSQTWNFEKIDPKSTYLRDSQFAPEPLVIQLGHLRQIGRYLEIRTVGWFNRASDNRAAANVSNEAVAVFSKDGLVDPNWTNRTRVAQAVDAGTDFFTFPTWVGNLATDIEQDFGIGPQAISVFMPDDGDFLMFTPFDNGFWNNADDFSIQGADPRGFGVEWRVIQTIPEPATWAVLGAGLLLSRRRRHSRI